MSEAYPEPFKDLRWSFLLKAIKSFQKKKKIILDIWVPNKRLIVTIDFNMYYCCKIVLKIY